MNFKNMMEKDLQAFHNSKEIAEIYDFWIDGTQYRGAIILDDVGASEREKTVHDNVPNVHREDLIIYIPLELIEKVPRKGFDFELSDKIYTITKVRESVGEVVLSLEVRAE